MLKKLLAGVVVLALAVAGGLWWLHGNLDGLIRDAIAKYGSEMTQAKVTVGGVQIGAADGRGAIRDLTIGNPAGFKTGHALKVGAIEVEIDLASLTRDVVLVKRIAILAPDVIYEKGDAMTNFDALQKNVQAYVGGSGKKSEGGTKLIVQQLVLKDAKAHASAAFMDGKTVGVPLPDITLRDIGKAKGGVTPGELGQAVTDALKQRLSASVSFDRLMKGAGQAIQDAGDAVKKLFK